jgi:hypothetical protein
VEISRNGDEIVLREKRGAVVRAFEILANLPEDATHIRRGEDRPQKRKGL